MYARRFLCEKAKIKQRSPLKKELCEIGEEAIWESRFTSFFTFRSFQINSKIFCKRYITIYCNFSLVNQFYTKLILW